MKHLQEEGLRTRNQLLKESEGLWEVTAFSYGRIDSFHGNSLPWGEGDHYLPWETWSKGGEFSLGISGGGEWGCREQEWAIRRPWEREGID